MNEKKNSVFVRVTEKEKSQIKTNAEKCGLTISEYIRKRALGFSPKALLNDNFYKSVELLGNLYETANDKVIKEKVLKLIDELLSIILSENRKDN